MTQKYEVIIIGAGAAGLMSAIEAGKRGRKVLLVDHSKKIGEKIRIAERHFRLYCFAKLTILLYKNFNEKF